MDRVRLFRGVTILVAVLAVATVAGGFTTGAGGDSDGERAPGFGFGDGSGTGIGDGDDVGFQPAQEGAGGPDFPTWIITGPLTLILLASAVFFVVFTAHTIWRGRLDELIAIIRKALVDFLAASVVLLALVALLVAINMLVGDGGGGMLGGGAASGPSATGGESAIQIPSTSLVGGIAIVLGLLGAFGAAIALDRESEDETPEAGSSSGGGHTADITAGGLGDMPGQATDVDPSNEVYRAWLAMRDQIGEPVAKTETPGGVQRRATRAGLDGEAAAELTALFCVVRYGEEPATDARERRATRLLSRIEDSRS